MFEEDDVRKEPEEAEVAAWMLTFADLVSLLICFFVLLYSMKTVDESIWKEITGSFAGALNYSQKFKKINPNEESSVAVEDILSEDSIGYIQSILTRKFEKEGVLKYVRFKRSDVDGSLSMVISGYDMFDGNGAQMTVLGKRIIEFISETVEYIDENIEVASFVGSSDIDSDDTMKLSMLRALEIRDFIKTKGTKKTIKVVGYGSMLYDSMKDVLTQEELEKEAVKVEFIIRSKK